VLTRRALEIAFAGATALFGAVVAWGAREYGVGWSPSGPEPGTFPFYIGLIVALASLANMAMAAGASQLAGRPFMTGDQARRIAGFVGPILVFVVLSLLLGLYVATALYIGAVMLVQGRYPLWHALLVAVGLPLALYLLLEKGFRVPLLKGPLEALIGL
jgi:hypothetical protein